MLAMREELATPKGQPLSRASESRPHSQATANSHENIEVVAVHERQVGYRHAAQSARSVCIGAAGSSDLSKHHRIARRAPRNSTLVFLVTLITHCIAYMTIVRRNNIDCVRTRLTTRFLAHSHRDSMRAGKLRARAFQTSERGVNYL